jgi:hypothetical protein
MDQPQHSRWWPSKAQVLWTGAIVALTLLIIGICVRLFGWKWTGLPEQTLWDWLELLIVPAVLAVGGYLFTLSENRRAEEAAAQGAKDAALRSYLDQMSVLLIDKHLHAEYRPHGDTRVTARARTLTVLEQLDGRRKRSVLQFLREARLINRRDEDLEGRLVQARVVGLDGADLTCADLKGLKLSDASLRETDLRDANLEGADLTGADLEGTDLTGARGVIYEELARQTCSLKGATMPNGQRYEAWLEGKGDNGEGGSASSP